MCELVVSEILEKETFAKRLWGPTRLPVMFKVLRLCDYRWEKKLARTYIRQCHSSQAMLNKASMKKQSGCEPLISLSSGVMFRAEDGHPIAVFFWIESIYSTYF